MKNPTLLRLAGIGLFGVTFVSPGSIERKDWILDELSSVQIFPTISFTSSAFCQETNYPKRSEIPAVEHDYHAVVNPSNVIRPATADLHSDPAPAKNPEIHRKVNVQPQQRPKKILTTDEVTKLPLLPTVSDVMDIDLATTEEKNITYTRPDSNTTINNDEQILLPPTDYVDEIKRDNPILTKTVIPIITRSAESGFDTYPYELLVNRVEKISLLARDFGYSTKYAFLLNLGLKSGKKRFLIVDLENNSIISSGLVAHGRGKEKFTLDKKYSNIYGSSCSSLGLYKVGSSYNGIFGKSFRLIGLEKTNSNALTRAIVLHSMNCIPDQEIDYPICQSEGCPSVSPAFLLEISRIIRQTDRPILLWAFDPGQDENFSP